MNYVDLIILVVVALFMYMGYRRGFIRDFLDLLALAGAIVIAYLTYKPVSQGIGSLFSLSENLAEIVSFFVVWFAVMFVYYGLMTFFYERVPERVQVSKYNRWLGLLPSLVRVILFVWFTINLLFLLLASGPVHGALEGSLFSRYLTRSNSTVNAFLDKTFGTTAKSAVEFLTVKPQSSETISLGFTTTKVTRNAAAAQEMFGLVNEVRRENGLPELTFDDKLAAVGEEHDHDMFARGYFSHNTPDGKTPFDRMDAAGIIYLIAGENLALAPSVQEAFDGLMNSPAHKANILSSDFGKVGIGVMDGGTYGLMFAQEFTN